MSSNTHDSVARSAVTAVDAAVGRRAVLDTFVRAGVINFSKFERQVEFIRADGSFVIIMGLETVEPVSDAPSAGLVAGTRSSAASRTSGRTRAVRGDCLRVTPM